MTPQPIDPAIQLARFRTAVQLLGGQRSAARALTVNERHIGRLLAGGSPLHSGMLTDLGSALLAHADQCRALERQLSPAFAANLTEHQPAPPKPRGRWTDKAFSAAQQDS